MYRSSLVTGLAAAFGVMSAVLAVVAIATGNWIALAPAVLFALTAYFMWYHASGRLAGRVYRTMEDAATDEQGAARTRERRRRAAADGPGGFGAGPRDDWEPPGGASGERGREGRQGGSQTRRERARDHARRVGGGRRRRRTRAEVETGMTRSEAASVLGVAADADAGAVRSAYRDRIKEVHPDTEDGDEEAFKRVRDAYERLQD